jgi:hypothetical protein
MREEKASVCFLCALKVRTERSSRVFNTPLMLRLIQTFTSGYLLLAATAADFSSPLPQRTFARRYRGGKL